MYLPFDDELCINPQDDTFLQKERWDFEGTAADKYPLLLNYHPLVIYRHQVLKQPDVVLADFLLGGRSSRIRKLRNYEYYTPLTTGDSSLSPCIQSIMASELGRTESAYSYFIHTARMDLDDINSNTSDGVHIAAMGGTWLSIVYGFAGFRDHGGRLSFAPRLPESWKQLKFRLRIKDSVLSVDISRDSAVFKMEEGRPLQISVRGADYTVGNEGTTTVDLTPRLKAVLFDLDGVITDTAEYHYLAWKRLADEKGYTFSREINERLRGIGRLESLDIILQASGVELTGEERAAQAALKNNYYREFIQQVSPEGILPGIREFISDLKADGIKTALASASRNARDVISSLGLEADFDLVVDAAEVRRGKPDPEVFITAAERLGFEPEDCAGIEDAEAGVAALKSAGIFSLGIGPAAAAADWSIETTADISLAELRKRFR
jgi:alpha,alpha-trehalose phosphorylase